MPRLAQDARLKILEEVFVHRKKVSSVCKKWGISRFTFYAWAKEYKQSGQVSDRTRRAGRHYKYIGGNHEKFILDLVLKNPTWTFAAVAGYLKIYRGGKFKTSVKGIINVLTRHNLKSKEERISFARTRPIKTLFAHKFSDFEKYKVVEEYLQGENKIARICRKYSISRFTFYAWLERYQESHTVSALASRRPKAETHWKYIGEAVKQKVIDAVVSNPTYSVHKLHAHLAGDAGHHAIQNILVRENLNRLDARMRFAQEYAGVPQAAVAPLYEVPVPRLSVWRLLFAPFKTVPKWIVKHPSSWPVVFPTLAFIAYIFEVDKLFHPTFFFPFIALTFGFFFFLYSLKYYASLIIVMRVSQRGAEREEKKKGRIISFLERYLRLGPAKIGRVDPLFLRLDKVQLTREPFVSVHLAIYNEKRVVARLLESCQNQQWGNFEIVIVDDSTDETTEIAKQFLRDNYGELREIRGDDGTEIYKAAPLINLPQITLIHRASRSGFKGGALQKALENTNARAEYVVVFDSDFVPYPDTIAQFVKTFQESCGGLDNIKNSNIAAVQGYQWHVLNKSQNWVTRGVRTEYAGSYVIERAGIGIYGGMNMIAGSVFAIRADVLRGFAWGRSITEDFELTLRLYERGFKVLFTPYIQAPAEAVSTVRRLIRQRMRWAEGHTFNIRKMAQRIFASPYVSRREKSEFVYLAPYYLQAAFFIVGTIAWFLSEIVLKVRLPFWTAAWGWSLVFVNFLALPLMNLVGLFLEESEERDYLGIASFLVLSYILVPFTAYAAVKALFEPSEGPWFRTPKTGLVTDVFDRAHIYNWLEKLKIWGSRPGAGMTRLPAPDGANLQGNLALSAVSAFNPLSGYSIKPKRMRFVARGALAILLIAVMFVNYLAFFAPQTEANHSANHIEQGLDIVIGGGRTVSTSYFPTDSSFGLVYWDSTKFASSDSSNPQVFLDVVIKTENSVSTASAALFADGDTATAIGTLTKTGDTNFTRLRSANIFSSLTTGTKYTVRFKTSNGADGAILNAARLIVTQNPGTGKVTKTNTAIEMAEFQNVVTGTSYTATFSTLYCYDSTSTGTSCAAASPSLFNPTPSYLFEATMKNDTAGATTYAELFACTSATDCSTGSDVTGSAVTVVGTTWGLARTAAGAFSLTAGKTYQVRAKVSAGTGTISNANIELQQSDTTNGVTNLETVQTTKNFTNPADTTYATNQNEPYQFDPANFSATTIKYYFESNIYQSNFKCTLGTTYAVLYNETAGATINTSSPPSSEVSTTATSPTRVRNATELKSAMPTAAKDLSPRLKIASSGTCNAASILSRLLIQLGTLNVPEDIVLAAPLAVFVPKVAKKIQLWFRKRKNSKGGQGKPGDE